MENTPDIFICGHSHIAKVQYDRKVGMLYMNPGAAGYNGFHKYMTALRFCIDGKDIHDMELIELGERGKVKNHLRGASSSPVSSCHSAQEFFNPVFN